MKNLKTKYENQFEIPSHLVWEKIEQKLDKDQKETKTIINYTSILWRVASVVILCSLIGWGIFFLNDENPKIIAKNPTKQEIEKVIISEKITSENENMAKVEKSHFPNKILENNQKNTPLPKENNRIMINKENINIEKNISTDSAKFIVKTSDIQPIPEKTEYITSGDLIFSREIEKTQSEQKKSNQQKIVTNIPEPKEIEVMGIKIYQKK